MAETPSQRNTKRPRISEASPLRAHLSPGHQNKQPIFQKTSDSFKKLNKCQISSIFKIWSSLSSREKGNTHKYLYQDTAERMQPTQVSGPTSFVQEILRNILAFEYTNNTYTRVEAFLVVLCHSLHWHTAQNSGYRKSFLQPWHHEGSLYFTGNGGTFTNCSC